MGITFNDKTVLFEGVIYEDEAVNFRDYLQQNAPELIRFDFSACEDVHLAIMQLVFAYKKSYGCEIKLPENDCVYAQALRGFDPSENYCNQQ